MICIDPPDILDDVTSSKKKHHPPAAVSAPAPAPKTVERSATTRQWVQRVLGALAVLAGCAMTLIGATPDIAGGWGKLVLMVPGMIIAAAGFIAVVDTTSMARHKRRG